MGVTTAKPLANRAVEREAETIQRRVLIVDGYRPAAQMLSSVLKLLGNDVRIAFDGQQGVEVAAAFLPAIVFMELDLPKLNGYEVARHIRKQPWGIEMLLVAVTCLGQDEDKLRSDDAGFAYHLVKPPELSDLRVLLRASKP